VVCELGSGGIFAAWTFLSLYVIVVGFAFLGRFLHGKWRSMRVIEERPPAPIPPTLPEAPTSEIDM